jgi:hypothetical protein
MKAQTIPLSLALKVKKKWGYTTAKDQSVLIHTCAQLDFSSEEIDAVILHLRESGGDKQK